MSISEIFIKRPIMTTLVMAAILIFGIFAYQLLPVSDLPNVDFPTILVSASLPGASPDTMASSVATPLEKQFSTIAGIDSMTSANSLGQTSITIQFNLSRNLDGAALDVQAAITAAGGQLPPRDADAADFPESESCRFAHPLSGAEFTDDEAVRHRRGRRDHHRPERLHGERRGPGDGLWSAEICHAGADRSQCSGFTPDRDRRSQRSAAIGKYQPSHRHPLWTEPYVHDSVQRAAHECSAVRAHGGGLSERLPGPPERSRPGD